MPCLAATMCTTSGAQTVMRTDSLPLRSTSADCNSSTAKRAGLGGVSPGAASSFAEPNSVPAAAAVDAARNRRRSTGSAMDTSPYPGLAHRPDAFAWLITQTIEHTLNRCMVPLPSRRRPGASRLSSVRCRETTALMTIKSNVAVLLSLIAGLGCSQAMSQVQTQVPPVVAGAKPVTVDHVRVHGASLEGNLEGDAVDRDVLVFL